MAKGAFGYAGMVTGLQRSYNSGFNFSIDIGAAYYTGQFEGAILPVANLSIGWIINEKRWCVGRWFSLRRTKEEFGWTKRREEANNLGYISYCISPDTFSSSTHKLNLSFKFIKFY